MSMLFRSPLYLMSGIFCCFAGNVTKTLSRRITFTPLTLLSLFPSLHQQQQPQQLQSFRNSWKKLSFLMWTISNGPGSRDFCRKRRNSENREGMMILKSWPNLVLEMEVKLSRALTFYKYKSFIQCVVQWGSEIPTSLNFEWLKRVWFANGLDFEWDLCVLIIYCVLNTITLKEHIRYFRWVMHDINPLWIRLEKFLIVIATYFLGIF